MRPFLFLAFLILLISSSSPAQQLPQTAPGDSSNVGERAAQGDTVPSGKNESRLGGGVRLAIHISTADNSYLNDQLSRFDVDGITTAWGAHIAGYVTRWNYYLEFELGLDNFPEEDMFEAKTHTVFVESVDLGVSARRGFDDILRKMWEGGPQIDLLPGISVTYVTDADVHMREKDRSDWTRTLEGSGWGYAIGVVLRWQPAFFEYRYRWIRLTDVKPDGGGEFFFPGDPELDFSGHFFAVGIDLGTHLKPRGRGR
jgi:hypothetical protein